MPYRIEFKKSAAKFLAGLPRQIQKQIAQKIDMLDADPYPDGCRKLKGTADDLYRIRSGGYRIVYTVIQERIVIYVLAIGDRKDIYNKLDRI